MYSKYLDGEDLSAHSILTCRPQARNLHCSEGTTIVNINNNIYHIVPSLRDKTYIASHRPSDDIFVNVTNNATKYR